jgi:hypothetical protein
MKTPNGDRAMKTSPNAATTPRGASAPITPPATADSIPAVAPSDAWSPRLVPQAGYQLTVKELHGEAEWAWCQAEAARIAAQPGRYAEARRLPSGHVAVFVDLPSACRRYLNGLDQAPASKAVKAAGRAA